MKMRTLAFLPATLLLAGCATTTIYDPETSVTDVRNVHSISSEEMRLAANAAIQDAMQNPRFQSFLQQYRTAANNVNARPILKLAKAVNDTDDPDLNMGELTDLLNTALLNYNFVDVTLAEGEGRAQEIANSRDIAMDPNFNQATVAQQGTLIAAQLVMRPKIISNVTHDGGRRVVVRTFVIDMADINSGLIIWKYTRQLGFVKSRGVIGY